MPNHLLWKSLEKMLEASDDLQAELAKKYPKEMVRWSVLRARQGRYCPMARGVLKLICYQEIKNARFNECLTNQKWEPDCLEPR